MQMAARIGKVFSLDPVHVLEDSNGIRTMIRIAASRVVASDERKSAEEQKRNSGRGRTPRRGRRR